MIRFLPSGEWLSALKATTVTGAVSLSIGQFLKLIAANSINLRPREPIYPAVWQDFAVVLRPSRACSTTIWPLQTSGEAMASWRRLTDRSGDTIEVNLVSSLSCSD
jgi:hypothetical protein